MLMVSPQLQHLNRLGGGVGVRGTSSTSEEGSRSDLFVGKGCELGSVKVLVMPNVGGALHLHGCGGSGGLEVGTVMSGQ